MVNYSLEPRTITTTGMDGGPLWCEHLSNLVDVEHTNDYYPQLDKTYETNLVARC